MSTPHESPRVPRCALPAGVLLLAICAAAGPLRGGDWPQWGGSDARNMVSMETHLPDGFVPGEKRSDGSGIDLSTTRNVKWVHKLGTQTYGNPTVCGGRIFLGTNDANIGDPRCQSTRGGLIQCLDQSTGKLLWQLVVPKNEIKKDNFNFDNLDLGICSSPTVQGNRLYVVTNRGEVLCLDVDGMANGNDGPFTAEGQYTVGSGKRPVTLGPRDGDILWRFDMINQLPSWPQDAANCSILVHCDLLYVCTSNGVDKTHDRVPCPLAPSLIVLDKHTGRLVAQDDEKIGTRLFHGQWSSPSKGQVRGRTLIFFGAGDGLCYAFEALDRHPEKLAYLKKIWSCDCNPPHYKVQNGQPVNYRDGDKRRKRGNKDDGTFLGPSEIIATPVFYDDRVYVAIGQDPLHGRARGMLTCIDATRTGDVTATGKLWTYDRMDRSLSTVSIADGLLYVADVAGVLHCLDARTGRPYWTHETQGEVWGSTLVADGKVFLGTKKSFWVLAAGREKRVLNEIYLGSPDHCTPVAAGGVLYVASHKYLWAVQAPGELTAGGEQ